MKVLFLCTAFNSLSQRVALVLKASGHAVTVELALSPELMISAAELSAPDIIICPFLTRRVPPAIYNRWLTLIVHPGPPSDAGPSALDWVLLGDLGECDNAEVELTMIDTMHGSPSTECRMRSHWGVTVLQAIEAFDAGPVWAFEQFELDKHTSSLSKSDLYRGPVTRAAVHAVLSAVELIRIVATQQNTSPPYSVDLKAPEFARTHSVTKGRPFLGGSTHDRPLLKASSRDFLHLRSNNGTPIRAETIVQRIKCGDSQPGVLTSLFGTPMFVYNAVSQTSPLPEHISVRAQIGGVGTVLATREGAVLVEIGADYPIWISHLRRPKTKADKYLHPKLPATMALLSMPECAARLGLLDAVSEWKLPENNGSEVATPWQKVQGTYQQVWVELEPFGDNGSKIGYVHSEFYNGAFSTTQCAILLEAINWTLAQPDLKAIVMLGGSGYFSNGIALNVIEGSEDPSAEGWANINAIDDCVQALLAPTGVLTFAAIRGNAAAGGLALATAADVVLCAESAVLNPHYRGIGLYGSEWHTYSWYERCGVDIASKFARDMLPMSSKEAQSVGLVDHVIDNDNMNAVHLLMEVKSIVRNIMNSSMSDFKIHIGAPWTRPLRSTSIEERMPLPQYMLRNKIKFLAYTFAGDGLNHLSFENHFQRYRQHELDQMSLDFFHPHRNLRFASRCTTFIRKVVPTSTPSRFALHRRYEGSSMGWDEEVNDIVHKDEEELDEFDNLGQYPAIAAVSRLPKCRPEYVQKVVCETEVQTRPEMIRSNSVSSSTCSLYSDSTSSPATISPLGPLTPGLSQAPPSSGEEQIVKASPQHLNINVTVAEDRALHLLPLRHMEDPKGVELGFPFVMSDQSVVPDKVQDSPQMMWTCYFSETAAKTSR